MVRVPLEELVLQIHLLKLGPANEFLQQVLEPPPAKSIEGALAQLQSVGALTKDEQLTPLGTHVLLSSCTCLCIKVISSACRLTLVASAAKSSQHTLISRLCMLHPVLQLVSSISCCSLPHPLTEALKIAATVHAFVRTPAFPGLCMLG